MSYNDPRIRELELQTKKRINQKLVRNQNYLKLLTWIDEFRDLNIRRVSATTPTRHILDSIENLDTVYEVWIFLEFVEYLHEQNILIDFQLGKDPHCEFEWGGVVVTFWYEKTFNPAFWYFGSISSNYHNAWAVQHSPDFVAMIGDKILGIFDAKNYGKRSSTSGAQNKMLSYLNNLDANFGALIFPNHPQYWDDLIKEKRMDKIKPVLMTKFPEESPNSIKNRASKQAELSWNELSSEYQKISPPHAIETMHNPEHGKKARYHLDQTLALLRMTPENTQFAIGLKNEALDFIFKSIVSRIPLVVKS